MKTIKASKYLSHSGHEFSANEKSPNLESRGFLKRTKCHRLKNTTFNHLLLLHIDLIVSSPNA